MALTGAEAAAVKEEPLAEVRPGQTVVGLGFNPSAGGEAAPAPPDAAVADAEGEQEEERVSREQRQRCAEPDLAARAAAAGLSAGLAAEALRCGTLQEANARECVIESLLPHSPHSFMLLGGHLSIFFSASLTASNVRDGRQARRVSTI